jgi:hypothetical protein
MQGITGSNTHADYVGSRLDGLYIGSDLRRPSPPRIVRNGEFEANQTSLVLGDPAGHGGFIGHAEERGGSGTWTAVVQLRAECESGPYWEPWRSLGMSGAGGGGEERRRERRGDAVMRLT